MEFNYFLPVNIVFGSGKVLETGELTRPYGKKALIVTGKSSAKKSGLYDKVNDSLKAAGLETALFDKVSQNPLTTTAQEGADFAKANGINVDKMRIWGITLSTVLGGIGILVYAQSFGFLQFYESPKMMSFSAVAAVLLGGASNKKASIFNVLFGVVIFQGLLTLSLPVANVILPESNISDIVRMIISNGIILYALGKGSGKK